MAAPFYKASSPLTWLLHHSAALAAQVLFKAGSMLSRSALGSHSGGCTINHCVAVGVMTWRTAPVEKFISAQEFDFVPNASQSITY